MRPITSFRPLLLLRNFLLPDLRSPNTAASLSVTQIGEVDRSTDIFIALLSALVLFLLFTALLLALSHFATLMSVEQELQ